MDIILARLKSVKAFEKFHPALLQQICLCGFYECLEKGITCEFNNDTKKILMIRFSFYTALSLLVYRQGDIGTNWYAVLSGSLDVKVSETANHQVHYYTYISTVHNSNIDLQLLLLEETHV